MWTICFNKIVHTGNNIKTHLKNFFIAPPGVHHLESFQLKLEPQLHKLGPINGFSPWWWRYACAGLKLELIPFHIFHIWVGLGLGGLWNIFSQSFLSFERKVTQCSNIRSPFQIFDHSTSKSSFILFSTCIRNFCINALHAMEQLCLLSKGEFQGRSSGWLWEHQGPLASLSSSWIHSPIFSFQSIPR